MPQIKFITVPSLFLLLTLVGCNASFNESESSSTSGGGNTTTERDGPNEQPPPSIGQNSKAPDLAAFGAYYKASGYTIKADRETFNPDGTVKSFYFTATLPQQLEQTGNTVTESIDTSSSANGRVSVVKTTLPVTPPAFRKPHNQLLAPTGVPPLTMFSTSNQINRYVDYYTQRGYTVTMNQQVYKPNGVIKLFRFEASKKMGTHQVDSTASAAIGTSMATQVVTNSETIGSYEIVYLPKYSVSFGK